MTQSNAEIVIDGRGLEPPEPLVRTLEALDQIGPAERLLVLLPHEPHRFTGHCSSTASPGKPPADQTARSKS